MEKKIPTQAEIDRQIQGLEGMKKTLPRKSMFGNDNWALIDAQVSVLKGTGKADNYYEDEHAEEYQDGDNDIYFAASKAEDWLKGQETEDLFEED